MNLIIKIDNFVKHSSLVYRLFFDENKLFVVIEKTHTDEFAIRVYIMSLLIQSIFA